MMVGPSGSGKSKAWQVLLKALERLEGTEGVAHVIDPKVGPQPSSPVKYVPFHCFYFLPHCNVSFYIYCVLLLFIQCYIKFEDWLKFWHIRIVKNCAFLSTLQSISKESLYGTLDPNTREWTDGLFTHVLRKYGGILLVSSPYSF